MSRVVWTFLALVAGLIVGALAYRGAPALVASGLTVLAPLAAGDHLAVGWTARLAIALSASIGVFIVLGAALADGVDAIGLRRAARALGAITLSRPDALEAIEAVLARPPLLRRYSAPFRAAFRLRGAKDIGLISANVPAALVLDTERALVRHWTRLAYRLGFALLWTAGAVLAAINLIGQATVMRQDFGLQALEPAASGSVVVALAPFMAGVVVLVLGVVMATLLRAGLARVGDVLGERVPAIDPDAALQEALGHLRPDSGGAPARFDEIADRLTQRLAEATAAGGGGINESKLVETFEALRDELAAGFSVNRESVRLLADTARDLDRIVQLLDELLRREGAPAPGAANEPLASSGPPPAAANNVGRSLSDLRRAIGDLLADSDLKSGRSHP